jgi:hypothetical protein
MPRDRIINQFQLLTITKYMFPERLSYGRIAQFTNITDRGIHCLAIKQGIKDGYMMFITFVEPARLRLNMYNWFPFNFQSTQ